MPEHRPHLPKPRRPPEAAFHFQLTPRMLARLRDASRQTGRPVSVIIRAGIDRELADISEEAA